MGKWGNGGMKGWGEIVCKGSFFVKGAEGSEGIEGGETVGALGFDHAIR